VARVIRRRRLCGVARLSVGTGCPVRETIEARAPDLGGPGPIRSE
jgi:hypothetical protein